jgi:hypothetical protein
MMVEKLKEVGILEGVERKVEEFRLRKTDFMEQPGPIIMDEQSSLLKLQISDDELIWIEVGKVSNTREGGERERGRERERERGREREREGERERERERERMMVVVVREER